MALVEAQEAIRLEALGEYYDGAVGQSEVQIRVLSLKRLDVS
jgi:hypothetical protein